MCRQHGGERGCRTGDGRDLCDRWNTRNHSDRRRRGVRCLDSGARYVHPMEGVGHDGPSYEHWCGQGRVRCGETVWSEMFYGGQGTLSSQQLFGGFATTTGIP